MARVVRDLLRLADRYYASGRAGLRYIPFRTRIAMAVAARLYARIGVRLRANGCDACDCVKLSRKKDDDGCAVVDRRSAPLAGLAIAPWLLSGWIGVARRRRRSSRLRR